MTFPCGCSKPDSLPAMNAHFVHTISYRFTVNELP